MMFWILLRIGIGAFVLFASQVCFKVALRDHGNAHKEPNNDATHLNSAAWQWVWFCALSIAAILLLVWAGYDLGQSIEIKSS